jgi:hypothetical protein
MATIGGDTGRRGGAEIGERNRQQCAVNDAANEIADKDPAPIGEDRLGVGIAFDPGQRQQTEAAGYKIEPEQHDEDEPDRKDQRADKGLIGLHRAGYGKARGGGEDGAGKPATNDQIGRRQRELCSPGIDHRGGDICWLHIVHIPGSNRKAAPTRFSCTSGRPGLQAP